ncbi:4a-hydroxytetrahydrobiopterin dehydratase [Flavobacteriaceae bacterium TP-CH-4]|uniref:Putative pterin-4-alpha-carbinolamine dehydratase n=1 Tax=Pelagihabitans pacificus TaxID=2696054 RepID=A0A967AY75_9FLAO|nr:4a-hydroxytetrahydrobiopterin dehydratase [Pelagihabitans pacificus]NHF59772.1 4a-hydroxytetrahydrobiopterin dehydratase [Pelagihabitans pacificus]
MEKLSVEQIEKRLAELDSWEFIDGAIETSLQFGNFKEAFATMTRIAFECELQGHHPDWSNVYNSLNIRLNTHDVGGVTEKDFKLAATIENIVFGE